MALPLLIRPLALLGGNWDQALAQALPAQELSVYVWCGCSYDSDLDHVEEVCKEVATETMARVEGCALD